MSAQVDPEVYLDGDHLTLEQVVAVARSDRQVRISNEAKVRMAASRALVDEWVRQGKIIYGITTGFGYLQKKDIPVDQVKLLQRNIILSHSAGVGEPLPTEAVRAMMLLRANALAKGYSGIRVEVVEKLLELLNRGVTPVVPIKGSVGSSGDLAPLAHMSLVLLGKGEAFYLGERLSGAEALGKIGLEPVELQAKEGLALTNGTQFMAAIGTLALVDAEQLARAADVAGAMSLEAVKGKSAAFAEEVHRLRPHRGQIDSAANIRSMIHESTLIDCQDADTASKRQDAYSLRCMPQVHGASRQAISYVRSVLETEINSATDNPLILTESGQSVSAGNFHGQPVALAMDFLALAVSELGSISERRIARLMDERDNYGLPGYLIDKPGPNSGLMLLQYTAAALASENKTLIHPASGDSIPTSANQEDHNSMGSIAARQAREVLENVTNIIGIELIAAAQALGIRERDGVLLGLGTSAGYCALRRHVAAVDEDRELSMDINAAANIIRSGELVRRVNVALQEKGEADLI